MHTRTQAKNQGRPQFVVCGRWLSLGLSTLLWLFLAACAGHSSGVLKDAVNAATSVLTPQAGTGGNTETAAPSAPVDEEAEVGVVTYVTGDVFIDAEMGGHVSSLTPTLAEPGQRASAFTIIRNGMRIRVEAGGSVTIVCYNNRVYRVVDRHTVQVTAQTCEDGAPVPPNSLPRVKPEAGVIKTVRGSIVIEGETREQRTDYGNLPIVVSPRNTHLLELAPEIRWVEVPSAIEYVLNLITATSMPEIVVTPAEIPCVEREFIEAYRVCSLPWPVDVWPLEPGQIYFLEVGARVSVASPLRMSASELTVLPAEAAEAVLAEVEAILALALDPVTEHLLLGGLYAEHELYSAAVAAYQTALAAQPAPVVAVTLGDTFRAVDLQEFAFHAYAQALHLLDAGLDDPLARAAAEFGQGQVEYSFRNYAAAEPHFARALALYERAGDGERLEAAREVLEMIRAQQ